MGHLPSQPHVLPQEPRAGKRPLRGQRAAGGGDEGPSRSGGLSPGGAGRMLGTPRHACACGGAPTVAPCGAVPPAVGSMGASSPQNTASPAWGGSPSPCLPPSRTSFCSSAESPPYQHPEPGRSGRTGVSPATRDGASVPGAPGATVPPLSTSRCSQVKNVADGASVQDETATLAYSEKPTSPVNAPPYSAPSYSYAPPNTSYYPSGTYSSRG